MSLKGFIAKMMDHHFPRLWMAFRVARRDKHFEPEFWFIPALCHRRGIAIDVGTNMGEYSYFMARHALQVVAFEPNPDLWPEIRRRAPTARIEGVALSDRSGSAEFRYVESNTGIATIEGHNALSMIGDRSSIRTREVALRTLDSFMFEGVSFLKIDVEGHEEAVLRGAEETLRRCRPSLLIESEDRHNAGAPNRLFSWLKEAGYNGYALLGSGLKSVTAPPAVTDRYVNNFIFLPVERDDLRQELFRLASH